MGVLTVRRPLFLFSLSQEASAGDALPKERINQEGRRHKVLEIRDPTQKRSKGKSGAARPEDAARSRRMEGCRRRQRTDDISDALEHKVKGRVFRGVLEF